MLPRYISHTDRITSYICNHGYKNNKRPCFRCRIVVEDCFFFGSSGQVDVDECYGAEDEAEDHDCDGVEEDAPAADAVDEVEGNESEEEVCEGDGERG